MFRRSVSRHRAWPGSPRPTCLLWLVLIVLFARQAPLPAAQEADSSVVRVIPIRFVDSAPSRAGSSTADLHPADESVRPATVDPGDKIGDPYRAEVILIGQGQPDLKTIPGKLMAAGVLVIPLDESLVKAFPGTSSERSSDGFTEAVNKLGGKYFLLGAIGGIYALGGSHDKQTAKLAFAALVNAGIATQGLKLLSGRERPEVSGGLVRFHGPGNTGNARQSFPSGHTSSAFAVATVLANRHPKQKWLYYGLATAVGLARIRKSAHFPSDVLVGAAIGIQAGNNALRHGPRIFSIKL